MDILKLLKSIAWAVCLAFLTYVIAEAIADWYVSQLKSSGGMVTAESILGARIAPIAFAVLVGLGTFVLVNDKK